MRARVISAVLMVLALATSAQAEDRQARGVPSLDRVLPEIRRTTPGRFYDAEGPFLAPDGRVTYRIKWMTPDGRIIWFDADARTGRIMNSGGGPTHYRDQDNSSDRQRNGGWDYGDQRDHRRDSDHDNFRDRDDRGDRDWQRDDRGGNWNRGGRDNDGWGNNSGRGDGGRGNRGGRRGRPGG